MRKMIRRLRFDFIYSLEFSIGFLVSLLLILAKVFQHFQFGTRAYDLGIQGSVAWNTAQGNWFYDSVHLQGNYLGDHFSPFYLFISWLFLIWESPLILLILQSLGIGLAAVALYKLVYRKFQSEKVATLFNCFHPDKPGI